MDLGKRVVKLGDDSDSSDTSPLSILVTSHGGFIKELNMVLVKEFNCSMPCDHGEYGRISPNTGLVLLNIVVSDIIIYRSYQVSDDI